MSIKKATKKPLPKKPQKEEVELFRPEGFAAAPATLTPKRALVARLIPMLALGVQGGPDGPTKTAPPTALDPKGELVCLFRLDAAACKKSKGSFLFELVTETRNKDLPDEARALNRRLIAAWSDGVRWFLMGRLGAAEAEDKFGDGVASITTDCYVDPDGCLVFFMYSDAADVYYSSVLKATKLPGTTDGTIE